jgi:hypothetical protein
MAPIRHNRVASGKNSWHFRCKARVKQCSIKGLGSVRTARQDNAILHYDSNTYPSGKALDGCYRQGEKAGSAPQAGIYWFENVLVSLILNIERLVTVGLWKLLGHLYYF